jgi:methylthioribulose-1-phosphate dehydratase
MKTLTDTARAALPQRANDICTVAAELACLGWTPATSSNFSMRLDDELIAVTVSGRDKGRLTADDIMVVNLDGQPVETELKPSAETLLHVQIYRRFADVGCVLHTHSHSQTVASRLFAEAGHIRLSGYELLKAFRGNATHELDVDVPVLPNDQDMPALAARIEPLLDQAGLFCYLIDGHGVYAWGRDLAEARRHLDALEFLLACELDLRRLRA